METAPLTDLLAKIDATQPAPTPIPSHDAEALAALNARFMDGVADRQAARETIQTLNLENAWLTKRREGLLKELDEDDTKARDRLMHEVFEHFTRNHGLTLSHYDLERKLDTIPNEEIVDRALASITDQLGGRSLADVATDDLREKFARRVYRPKRQGRNLTLGGYLYVEDRYDGSKNLSYGAREELGLLATALHRFEHDEIITQSSLHGTLYRLTDYHTPIPFGEAIDTRNDRCAAITLYRNGNVRLGFSDDATAAAFVAFYGLKLTD